MTSITHHHGQNSRLLSGKRVDNGGWTEIGEGEKERTTKTVERFSTNERIREAKSSFGARKTIDTNKWRTRKGGKCGKRGFDVACSLRAA